MNKKPINSREIKELPHNYASSLELSSGAIGSGKSFLASFFFVEDVKKNMVTTGISRIRLNKSKAGKRFVRTIERFTK